MASDQVMVAALGRPFKLGMLYDARRDQLITGTALWDSGKLQSMTRRRRQPYSNFTITASDSTQEKVSLLEIQASLRASVLSGFVKGEGSAQYLHEQKQFMNQSRVTLQYKATTHFEQLVLEEDDCEKIQSRELGQVTHVVTGIEYGANAFFVFDSQKLEASDVKEFSLKIKVVVNLILWSVHFDYSRDLTEEQKSLVKQLTVKFYSDFLLESEPSTFTEAVQTYTDMTELLGKNDQNAVPLKVWMMPLAILNPKAAQLVRDISVGLVIDAEDALEELSDIQMRCNDCLSVDAVGKFHQLQHQLHMFHTLCHHYTSELQRQMADTCPAIREGKADESVLRSVFDERRSSPFSQDRLTKWLENKEREVNVVESILEILTGVQVLSTKAQVDRVVLAPGDDVRFGYVFTSLETTDAQLEDMRRYLDSLKRGQGYEPLERESEQPWCCSDQIVTKMRAMAESFSRTKGSATVFVAAENQDKQSGAAVLKYRQGILANGRFKVSETKLVWRRNKKRTRTKN